MRKIFDIHMHFPRNWEKPDSDPKPLVENLYERAKAAGITKANLLCGGRWGISHEDSIKHAHRHPDLFIPTAMIDPETTTPERLVELRDLGYRGLKMIGVLRDYDCPDYFPMYEKAQELGWPILLHMGVIGGGIDYRDHAPATRSGGSGGFPALGTDRRRRAQHLGDADAAVPPRHDRQQLPAAASSSARTSAAPATTTKRRPSRAGVTTCTSTSAAARRSSATPSSGG